MRVPSPPLLLLFLTCGAWVSTFNAAAASAASDTTRGAVRSAGVANSVGYLQPLPRERLVYTLRDRPQLVKRCSGEELKGNKKACQAAYKPLAKFLAQQNNTFNVSGCNR